MEFYQFNYEQESTGFDWIGLITSLGSIVVGAVAVLISFIVSRQSFKEKKLEEQRLQLNKKLNEFYGPLYQLRKKSNILYKKFRQKFEETDPDFSTLRYLLNGYKFEGNDKVLLEEIINIGKQSEELIQANAGLIDLPELRNELIPKATTHFLIIRLAYLEKLVGEEEKYRDSTFPKKLDDVLEKRKTDLENELNKLLK